LKQKPRFALAGRFLPYFWRAYSLVRSIDGVREVVNQIEVIRLGRPSAPRSLDEG
jgi:hypothetical protein